MFTERTVIGVLIAASFEVAAVKRVSVLLGASSRLVPTMSIAWPLLPVEEETAVIVGTLAIS